MIISTLSEIFRYTFPRNLRFCRQCHILHSQLMAVDKRYKDRKYVPRSEVATIIDSYVPGPQPLGLPFFRWPVLRSIFFVRGINTIRVWRGYPSWLYTRAVRHEHKRVCDWFDKNGNTTLWIKRDKFKEEVLDEFKVAQQYHKFFMLGVVVVTSLLLFLAAGAASEPLLYSYLVYWRGMSKEEVATFMADLLEEHASVDTPEKYKSVLPPASFRLRHTPGSDPSATKKTEGEKYADDRTIYFNVVEMTSPTGNARVIFIPCPKVGTPSFYKQVGNICRSCSAILLEEVPLEYLHQMPPAFFFFPEGRDSYAFPALNLHHRVYDIISDDPDTPPPKLLPGAVKQRLSTRYLLGMLPFSFKTLYFPYFLAGSKSEAKMAWGTLKAVVRGEGFFPINIELQLDAREEAKKQQAATGKATTSTLLPGAKSQKEREAEQPRAQQEAPSGPNYVVDAAPQLDPTSPHLLTSERRIYPSIAVPWTVAQISNLEASMYRAGWKVTNQTSIEWLAPEQAGRAFFDHHQNRIARSHVLDAIWGAPAPAAAAEPGKKPAAQ